MVIFLGIADAILDAEALCLGPFACAGDQIVRDVGADDRGAALCDQTRGPSRSCREVKYALARLRVEPQHAVLDRVGNAPADLIVACPAGTPDCRRPGVVWFNGGSDGHACFSLTSGLPVTTGSPAARHSGKPSSSLRALNPRVRNAATAS